MGSLFELVERLDPVRALAALEAAADALELGVFVCRYVGEIPEIVHVNARGAALMGRDLSELIGRPALALFAGLERDQVAALVASRAGGPAPPIHLEFVMQTGDRGPVPFEIGLARADGPDGRWALGWFRDATERRRVDAALVASETRFRTVVESAPDGVVILRGPVITFMNARAARMLGLPSPDAGIGRPIMSLLPPEEGARAGERIAEMFRSGKEFTPLEYRALVDGEERRVEIKSIIIEYEGAPAVLAFARDVTERHALHQELVRADRLAAVGTLAAAVAHEINNPLTYAQLSLQFIERELAAASLPEAPRAALLEHLRNARHGTERVATIVRDLRTFARDDDGPSGPVDVVAVVEQAIKIAENDLRHRARLVRRYREVPAVAGTSSRLEQVFLNLLINAIHALPDGDPSRDEIAVEIELAAEADCAPMVEVTVADTGPGIPPEVRSRMFDAFFTTKPVGEGTGLGLSVCRSIVEGLGGTIEVVDGPAPGTRVRVRLPAHEPASRGASSPPPPPAETASRRRYRVLVVDDEPLVRRVMTMALKPHHDLEVVDSGEAALAAIERRAPDVVLCDLMMPGMNGMDLFEAVRASRPALARRFVFVTGGAFLPRLAQFLDRVENPTLLKPFDAGQILAIVLEAATR